MCLSCGFIGLDDMRKEKSREECYREATQFMNKGENAINYTGMKRTALDFLTRGTLVPLFCCMHVR